MNRTIRINLWRILTLVLLVSLVLPWTAFAAVWTDKLDYSPGETVTILGDNSNGIGYYPGETVHVDVVGPNDYTAMCDGVAADTDNADWSCQVTLWDSDLAYGTYYYTATGQYSGVVEQGTFTDGLRVESRDGDCSVITKKFALNEIVCAKVQGSGGNTSEATVEWWDPHGELAYTSETIYGNGEDTRTPFALGTWTIKLYANGKLKSTATFTVIPDVTIVSPSEDYAVFDITSGVEVTYSWTDPGEEDTFDCTVDWADGEKVEILNCSPQTTAHAYAEVGIYTITITVVDDHEGIGEASIVVVVYDPEAGFVTGGGRFDSPAHSYRMEGQVEDLGGPATFGFISKYHRGANMPEGETEFQFHQAGFRFHSDTYEWLVVNKDGTNAQYKGVGVCTVEGVDRACSFMLWGTDGETVGGVDKFRIAIWDGAEAPLYDNGTDTPIEEGTIIVHTSGK